MMTFIGVSPTTRIAVNISSSQQSHDLLDQTVTLLTDFGTPTAPGRLHQ
jgi:hypothetical protein